MLNLDQVRLLENRVEKAVAKIQMLTAENTTLRSQLSGLQSRANELEGLVRAFKDDQGRIEEGILNALDRLSAFEDTVLNSNERTETPASVSEQEYPDIIETSEPSAFDIEEQTPDTENTPDTDGQMGIF